MEDLRPNILWIVTTQWRAGACGFAGDRNVRTPCVDRLAAEGIRCTAAVTPHPFGPFARAALLTGVPCPENGVLGYFDPLPRTSVTVAHRLGALGYRTGWFGKWHLAPKDTKAALVGEAHARTWVAPEDRGGFAFWEGFEGGFLLNDPFLHGSRLTEPTRFLGYQSDVVSQRAADWLSESSRVAEPWFCVVSLEAPHPPYGAAAPAARRQVERLELEPNVPRGGEVEAQARAELSGYYAHIEATDRALGNLLQRVGASGRRATRVVFTSVHGDMHGAQGLFRKGWPHEQSVRVPLVLGCFGLQASGVEERPVSLLELPNMALAWAQGARWEPDGRAVSLSMPSVVRLPRQCDRRWCGWRGRDWKVIWVEEQREPWLVFDLARDPWEMNNLAGQAAGEEIVGRAVARQVEVGGAKRFS